MLTDGPYAIVRHPRYLMVLVGIVGWALMANFSSAYVTSGACIICMLAVVALEERELRNRFGDAYITYSNQVPQIIPKPQDLPRLWRL